MDKIEEKNPIKKLSKNLILNNKIKKKLKNTRKIKSNSIMQV